MECLHCFSEFDANKHVNTKKGSILYDGNTQVLIFHFDCPDCRRPNIYYCIVDGEETSGLEFPIYPRPGSRKPCPPETPQLVSEDYYEACLLVQSNPIASAILSRRCLENIIFDITKVESRYWSEGFKELKKIMNLPSNLIEQIDCIRKIGNSAAHGENINKSEESISINYKEANKSLNMLSELLYYFYSKI